MRPWTLWYTLTDEATAGRWSEGRRFRCGHRTAAVVIASAKKFLRKANYGQLLLPIRCAHFATEFLFWFINMV